MSETVFEPDKDQLMEHIRAFSRRVKLSGTPEELESFRYLQAQMESYGYDVRLIQHDAYISLPGKARVIVDGRVLRCITHSMSVSTPGVSAELVYVGEGTAAEFRVADVAGKVVLVDGIATEEVAALASAAGGSASFMSVPTNTSTKCVCRPCGAALHSTRVQISRPPSSVLCLMTKGRNCVHAASEGRRSMSPCRPRWIQVGAKRLCWSPS